MRSAADFRVFDAWKEAPAYAFGRRGSSGVVPQRDKEAYWNIHSEIVEAANSALGNVSSAVELLVRPKPHSRERGSRGHCPLDLWVSVCGKEAKAFGYMPQIFIIASEHGIELGFAASIPEDDYFDGNVKSRNRAIVPLINSKLPGPTDPTTAALDNTLALQGGWHFNSKTRLSPGTDGYDRYSSAATLFAHVKTAGATTGGGCISRTTAVTQLADLDLTLEFTRALSTFLPLIIGCLPTSWDADIRAAQAEADSLTGEISFDPSNIIDGRKKILTQLAVRQGQRRFRSDLLEAYQGRCAITGTAVADVLHAAHISPYMGPATNHVGNGLLLRADLHNLFDLKLIKIDPASLTVMVSEALHGTEYQHFDGKRIRVPADAAKRPSPEALTKHFMTTGTTSDETALTSEPT